MAAGSARSTREDEKNKNRLPRRPGSDHFPRTYMRYPLPRVPGSAQHMGGPGFLFLAPALEEPAPIDRSHRGRARPARAGAASRSKRAKRSAQWVVDCPSAGPRRRLPTAVGCAGPRTTLRRHGASEPLRRVGRKLASSTGDAPRTRNPIDSTSTVACATEEAERVARPRRNRRGGAGHGGCEHAGAGFRSAGTGDSHRVGGCGGRLGPRLRSGAGRDADRTRADLAHGDALWDADRSDAWPDRGIGDALRRAGAAASERLERPGARQARSFALATPNSASEMIPSSARRRSFAS